ncbi:MAG: cbb3-type cytochrome c oxidase subunit I [Gemmatimonadota bacterium]
MTDRPAATHHGESPVTEGAEPWRPFADGHPVQQFATLTFIRGGLVAIGVVIAAGILTALYSVPSLAPAFQSIGLDLRQLRPLHTAFAAAWIFLGGVAVVHRFLQDHGPPTPGVRLRLRIQVACWAIAGIGIIGSLLFGIGSGREYVGFHPIFSLFILVGWVCYAWNFFLIAGPRFWEGPVYLTMWGVGMLFFIVTFLEQHAYLISGVFGDPVLDLRIQWKAVGTLVGSMNLFVYGSVIYIGERISRDGSYGHSKTAYALLGVGLLNSFTNFAHHTYHLPERELVKWIAFVVSMLEIIILARAVFDLWTMARKPKDHAFCAARGFFHAAKWWSVAIIFSAVLLSIPPLNSIVHGTYVVPGHAMGAMIGIDSMILLGAIIWILSEHLQAREGEAAWETLHTRPIRRIVLGLNLSVASLVLWLHVVGVATGVTRGTFAPNETYVPPGWVTAYGGIGFAVTGSLTLVFFVLLLMKLWPPAFRYFWVAPERG